MRISIYRILITCYSQPHHYHWPAMVGRREPNSGLNPEISSLLRSAPFSPASVDPGKLSERPELYLHSPEPTRDFTSLHRACDQLSATLLGRTVTAFVGKALSARGRGATCQGHAKVNKPGSVRSTDETWSFRVGFQNIPISSMCWASVPQRSLHQLHQSHYQQAWLNKNADTHQGRNPTQEIRLSGELAGGLLCGCWPELSRLRTIMMIFGFISFLPIPSLPTLPSHSASIL